MQQVGEARALWLVLTPEEWNVYSVSSVDDASLRRSDMSSNSLFTAVCFGGVVCQINKFPQTSHSSGVKRLFSKLAHKHCTPPE
jgi:hypothetical protein